MTGDQAGRSGPLQGVRVLELGGIGPGPFCAMLLADLGADVVRVHRVGDSPFPSPVLDRGRRSVAVDLKDPAGVEIVTDLAADSDVLVEGFRPGVLERLGLGPDVLHRVNPRLVIGRMTGFGQDGDFATRAGHDINYISISGALAAIGRRGGPPTPPLNLVGDFGGGGMVLAFGIVSALLVARESGHGQVVDAAMVDGSAALMGMVYGYHGLGQWSSERGDNFFDSGTPYYDVYECADGGFMAVGAIEPQFFALLVDRLGLGGTIDLAAQQDRSTWDHQRASFARAFAARPRADWEEVFADVDACVTPVLDMAEAPAHRHNVSRGVFTQVDGMTQPAPVPRFSGTPAAAPEPPPSVGQHTDEILAGLGRGREEIEALRAQGVVS